jgi:mono/diheme cytochrome c family protein
VTCHVAATDTHIAPPFDGLAVRAATRVAGQDAAAYLIESILAPRAYIVEGFAETMPQNFRERLSDADAADIVAYLLADHES